MSEEIVWGAGMDDAEFNRGIKRMLKDIDTLKQKLKDAQDQSKKATTEQKSSFDGAIASLGQMAAGWVSVQTAVQIATAEYQAYIDLQEKAKDATIDTANAQIAFFRNLGDVSSEEAKKIQETIRGIAAANRTTEGKVYTIAKSARSSQGNLTDAEMFANIGMASRMAPDVLSESTAISSALNAASRLTGSADPEVNAGLLLGVGKQTRIEEMAQIAKTLIPTAAGIRATLPGTSTEEAVASFATLTSISEDDTGSTSGTAMLQLAAQLKKLRKGTDLGAEIAALQNDEKARNEFFAKASFEVKSQPHIEKMLTGGTAQANLYQQNLADVPTGANAVARSRRFFGNVNASSYQQVAQKDAAYASAVDQLKLGNQKGAGTATDRAGVLAALKASGQGGTSNFMSRIEYDFARLTGEYDSPEDAAVKMLQGRADFMRGKISPESTRTTASDPAVEMQAKKLDELIAQIKGLRSDQKNIPRPKDIDGHIDK